MKAVYEFLGVPRSNLTVKSQHPAEWVDRRKTPALDDMPLITELRDLVADLPTYGYRRAWALLRRRRDTLGQPESMQNGFFASCCHGLLLEHRPRHAHLGVVTMARLQWTRATFIGVRMASNSAATTAPPCASSLHWAAATGKP